MSPALWPVCHKVRIVVQVQLQIHMLYIILLCQVIQTKKPSSTNTSPILGLQRL